MSQTIKRPVGITTCQTAFGWVGIAWSRQGLVAITLPKQVKAEALEQLPPTGGPIPDPPHGLDLSVLVGKLQRYFEGQVVAFDEPLDPTLGTGFQRRVWQLTRDIPRGQTRTYGQIARLAGSPGAARAVGQAMARNPRPIIVPCHRVLGSDGGLTGFGGGVDMKRRMLQLEGAAVLVQPLLDDFKLDAHA
jgi:methylated-DNA-[protein]-cysteine S-methyltransferase